LPEFSSRNARKRPVVLLVEDEFLVRMGTKAAVETAGFDVLEASDADEAIAILAVRNDIRLIFTDVHMPGSMDGLKLTHFVRDRWPPVKIVATSGRVRITDSDLPEGGRFLPKPYSAGDIAATLHELIQGQSSQRRAVIPGWRPASSSWLKQPAPARPKTAASRRPGRQKAR
jgi:CheY-like chemotaxis protein